MRSGSHCTPSIPTTLNFGRDLRVSQNKLAGFRAKIGDLEAGGKLYEESLSHSKSEPVTAKNRTVILADLRFYDRLASLPSRRSKVRVY